MLHALRPPSLPVAALQQFVKQRYGVTGAWTALDGERDQNFRVTAHDGVFVFKLCNAHEGDDIMRCQAELLDHIASADPDLPVPRLLRAREGEALPAFEFEGRRHLAMLLSYLPGAVIGSRDLKPSALAEFGRLLARLGIAMRGFVHGAPAMRKLVWDTRLAGSLASQISAVQAEDRALAHEIMDRHTGVTAPLLARLRAQIIHGDVHPFNTLTSDDGTISGIIDFGDMVHGALVQDLSNAAADFLFEGRDHEAVIFEIVRAYASVTRLEEDEADVILDMIETRLLMTDLVEHLKAGDGIVSRGSFDTFNGRSMPLIRSLRARGRDRLQASIRRAAAFPAKRQTPEDLGGVIARRRQVMGQKLYVFYDPPLHIVKGEGVWLTGADGRRYMDCYNNVPHVGHCHPYVTEAIVRQARTLNTNTRYITGQSIDYAERLAALAGEGLSAVVFVNSGSEANDLAFRMAKAWTGKSGGLAMDFAYHGVTESMDAFSPSNSPATWHAPHVRLLPAPCTYRGAFGPGEPGLGERFAALADPLIAELEQQGFGAAAAMIDSAFMSNGILDAPRGYLQGIVRRVHAAGGLFIADEVQSGFGRMGTAFWGHKHHGVTPDFITIGKPAGNGHPVGAVITRPEILERFTAFGPFFSTFGGNNVACAAGIAVLDVIRDEGLVENARAVGEYFRAKLKEIEAQHDIFGDVRGMGLATGVELVRERRTKEPASAETARLLNLLRDEGVLVGSEGRFGNVLKIRPPVVFTRENADWAAAGLARALARL